MFKCLTLSGAVEILSGKPPMMRTDEATVLLLDKMLETMRTLSEQTGKNTKLIEQQIPEGIIDPKEVTATTTPFSIIPPFDKRWFSLSVVNDGPDSCYVVVNTEKSSTNPYLLKMHETFEVDLGVAKIVDAQVWCSTGTSGLRVRGVR